MVVYNHEQLTLLNHSQSAVSSESLLTSWGTVADSSMVWRSNLGGKNFRKVCREASNATRPTVGDKQTSIMIYDALLHFKGRWNWIVFWESGCLNFSVGYLFEQGFTESLGGSTVVNARQWIYVDFWCLGHLPWMQAEHAGKNEMLSCNKGVPVYWVWENLKLQKFSSSENKFKLQNIIRIWFCCCHDLSWECLSCLWTSTSMYICSPLFTANPLRNIMPQSQFWGVNVNIQILGGWPELFPPILRFRLMFPYGYGSTWGYAKNGWPRTEGNCPFHIIFIWDKYG